MKRFITRSIIILATFVAVTASAKTYTTDQIAAESKRANEFFDKCWDDFVAHHPQTAARLGLKSNYDKWDDISDAQAVAEIRVDELELVVGETDHRRKIRAVERNRRRVALCRIDRERNSMRAKERRRIAAQAHDNVACLDRFVTSRRTHLDRPHVRALSIGIERNDLRAPFR